MRSLRLLYALLLFMFAGAGQVAHAARAGFTLDGKTIYLAAGKLKKLDLARPDHFDEITTSPLFGGEEIQAVTRLNDGRILCLSVHHLATFDPRSQKFERYYDRNLGSAEFDDVAVDPSRKILLVTLEIPSRSWERLSKLVCFQKDCPTSMGVFSRRISEMEGPIFDPHGNLYFSSHGDLWRGGVYLEKLDDHGTSTPTNMRGVLTGERIAPLARLETYEGTPVGTRVMEIAPAGRLIYIHTQRMYGSGWGSIMTMATPPLDEAHDDGDYTDFITALSSIKVIDEAGSATWLCVSADEKKIFYQAGRTHWLIENGRKPRKLPVPGYIWP